MPKHGAGGMGKSSVGKTGKSTGFEGKTSTSTGSSSKKPTTLGSSGKSLSPFVPSSSKSYSSASSNSPKNKTTFGILWIPSKRHNKKKDMVFNSHRDDRMLRERERSPSMYNIMSGDSDHNRKKKEEETTLLVPDKVKSSLPSVTTSGVVATEALAEASSTPEEKQEFIQRDKGDNNEKETTNDNDKDYLENKENDNIPELKTADKSTEYENGKIGDKVDSVYLRSPPPHKARSTNSTAVEDDGCGIKCLYFTLQCCDCVLM